MSIDDYQPQPNDWVVDIEAYGNLANNRLWGSAAELFPLLQAEIEAMGGTATASDVPRLIEPDECSCSRN